MEPPEPNAIEFHFLLISPHPKGLATEVRTTARGFLSAWLQEQKDNAHYVANGVPMDLWSFGQMARDHVQRLDNLASMMD